ncbi:MAG: DUF4238 domain-containing protein, partial [Devosia sp.]
GPDNFVCQMRLMNGHVVPGRYHPNATGYERDLYKTVGMTKDVEQHLEENFFKPVDTAAERVLQKMLAFDKAPMSSEERSAWIRYLLSLRFRNPDTVVDLKLHMLNVWSTAKDSIKKNFATWRRDDDPETWEEFEKLLAPAAPHIGATNLLIEIIDNDRIGPVIFDMHWSLHRLIDSKVPLLTSDRPLDWPAGLSHPKAYIALAVSPDIVFVAANDRAMQGWAKSQAHSQLAKGLNKAVVTQAREYVWGTDDGQIDFVRKHFGTAPIYSAITEAQKAEALRVAAGGDVMRPM